MNPCCSQELMEGDQITKPEGIEVPAGFARDEIGHEIPKGCAAAAHSPRCSLRAASLPAHCCAAAAPLPALPLVAEKACLFVFNILNLTFHSFNFNNSSIQF